MLRWLVAFLLLALPASAQQNASYAGYAYPQLNQGVVAGLCSPLCTSASAEWTVATVTYSGSGSTEILVQWIGIMGNFTTGSDANNCIPAGYQCLGQFGTRGQVTTGGVASYEAWFELFCPNAPVAPCNNLQGPVGGMVITAGDHIKATMACITNCSPAYSASAEWSVVLTDITSGVTCNMTPAKACGVVCTTGAESGCQNWMLGQGVVLFAVEPPADRIPLFAATPFTNMKVNGSTPVWTDIRHAALFRNAATGGSSTMFSSTLIGGNGTSFYVCRASGSYSAAADFCGASAYKGTAGLGVQ